MSGIGQETQPSKTRPAKEGPPRGHIPGRTATPLHHDITQEVQQHQRQ